jgi:hypothetical protein
MPFTIVDTIVILMCLVQYGKQLKHTISDEMNLALVLILHLSAESFGRHQRP